MKDDFVTGGWHHLEAYSFTYLLPAQDTLKNRALPDCPRVASPCGLASSQHADSWVVGLLTGCLRTPELRLPSNKLEAACPFMIQPHKSYDVISTLLVEVVPYLSRFKSRRSTLHFLIAGFSVNLGVHFWFCFLGEHLKMFIWMNELIVESVICR